MKFLPFPLLLCATLGLACTTSRDAVDTNGQAQDAPAAPRPSGKTLIQFKGFEYGKEWSAEFEVVNDTGQAILYVGTGRRGADDYCTRAVQREATNSMSIKVSSGCYVYTNVGLQTIAPGEAFRFSIGEHEVRTMLGVKDPNADTTAQVGFEVFVGDAKSREIVWSDEITFRPEKYPAPAATPN